MAARSYPAPIPTRASKASVSAFAERLAESWGFSAGDPIEPIVAQLGGAISFTNPVGETHPESIRVEADRTFRIFLPSMTSQRRDRFTTAHELGHFLLHFPLVEAAHPGQGMRATRWVDDTDPDQQRCEWEANWFAAAFIMPEVAFRSVFSSQGLWGAQSVFDVSDKAANVRAKSLGLS